MASTAPLVGASKEMAEGFWARLLKSIPQDVRDVCQDFRGGSSAGNRGDASVAHIHELIRQLRASNPALGDEMAREVELLAQRRPFGLNFERHTPEAVELPTRRLRVGDTVRILPSRDRSETAKDTRLWRIISISSEGGSRIARVELASADGNTPPSRVSVDDLVFVAEFRDPIYPGLVSTGMVKRGGDKPFHSVINAENYHALQALLYTHRGMVDAIYIDPPYNTGARDWKYDNDYVEGDDIYRHSKWLAFIERRLLLAKELMNPADSVLIVTIDEKEYLRLGLLLEQVFPEARIQMVSTVIKPGGVARDGYFARATEYVFIAMLGRSTPAPLALGELWGGKKASRGDALYWNTLWRSGSSPQREGHADTFYPIFVEPEFGRIVRIGDPIGEGVDRSMTKAEPNSVVVWPIRNDGSEGRWQLGAPAARRAAESGYIKVGKVTGEKTRLYYLAKGEQRRIAEGLITVIGRRADGSVIGANPGGRDFVPTDQWAIPSHDATRHGSIALSAMLPGRSFPYPKALYAVEDALRFFVASKADATIIDFFSGSGTTAHAVMRLNKQDGGSRRSISVTNNEVSADEQRKLRASGLRPGDPEWEQWGICDYITKPRIEAAVTGTTPNGDPIKGDYKFTDEFPMADGLEENVEFFTLTYEAPLRVQSHREFAKIAPLLWLRAGSRGRRIDKLPDGWDVADTYGAIDDIDQTGAFVEAMAANPDATIAFIVTDEDRFFEAIANALPAEVEVVRLYDSYLRNFEIDAMRGVR